MDLCYAPHALLVHDRQLRFGPVDDSLQSLPPALARWASIEGLTRADVESFLQRQQLSSTSRPLRPRLMHALHELAIRIDPRRSAWGPVNAHEPASVR